MSLKSVEFVSHRRTACDLTQLLVAPRSNLAQSNPERYPCLMSKNSKIKRYINVICLSFYAGAEYDLLHPQNILTGCYENGYCEGYLGLR